MKITSKDGCKIHEEARDMSKLSVQAMCYFIPLYGYWNSPLLTDSSVVVVIGSGVTLSVVPLIVSEVLVIIINYIRSPAFMCVCRPFFIR